MATIFYSWQADTSPKTGRNLVHRALEDAVNMLNAEADVEVEDADREELEVDNDTKGTPGSPPIVDTIFKKIDAASVFVADLTFVGTRIDGRPVPNPNVAIEYGWALRALTHGRVIAVMNVAHGQPTADSLPFDLRHVRWPMQFDCPDDADEQTLKDVRRRLARDLKGAIAAVLEEAPVALPQAKPFIAREPAEGQSRFSKSGQPVGSAMLREYGSHRGRLVYLQPGSSMWMRLMPLAPLGRDLEISEIDQAVNSVERPVVPLNHFGRGRGLYTLRSQESSGYCNLKSDDDEIAQALIVLFRNGEVWTIDTHLSQYYDDDENPNDAVLFNKEQVVEGLRTCACILRRAGISGPYRWIAGIEGILGRRLENEGWIPARFPSDPFAANMCEKSGMFSGDDAEAEDALQPFFKELGDHARRSV